MNPGAKPLATAGGNGNAATADWFPLMASRSTPTMGRSRRKNLNCPHAPPCRHDRNAQHEQQLEAALRDDPQHPHPKKLPGAFVVDVKSSTSFRQDRVVQFSQTCSRKKLSSGSAIGATRKHKIPPSTGMSNCAPAPLSQLAVRSHKCAR